MQTNPVASIIIATYNRPDVLRFAIESVILSSFHDWELLIIGDCCSDSTIDAVSEFNDSRIYFRNLPKHSGNQFAPNNAGVARARGKYVLFLNQDDMYFGAHIKQSIEYLETSKADIAFSPVALLRRSGRTSGPPNQEDDILLLDGVSPQGFDPTVFAIASSWIVRREVCLAVGDWVAPEKTRISPSQEWLFRAWRRGYKIKYNPRISVLCIHAGIRRLSYLVASQDHERAWTWVKGREAPGEELLHCIAVVNAAIASKKSRPLSRQIVYRLIRQLGIHPHVLLKFLKGEKRGSLISKIRAFTEDPVPLREGDLLRLGEPAATEYLLAGWHDGEVNGRWSSARQGTVAFAIESEARDLRVEIVGGPLLLSEEVTFMVDGVVELKRSFSARHEVVSLPIMPGLKRVVLRVVVNQTTSPVAIGLSSDRRELGFYIETIRLVASPSASGRENTLSDGNHNGAARRGHSTVSSPDKRAPQNQMHAGNAFRCA